MFNRIIWKIVEAKFDRYFTENVQYYEAALAQTVLDQAPFKEDGVAHLFVGVMTLEQLKDRAAALLPVVTARRGLVPSCALIPERDM